MMRDPRDGLSFDPFNGLGSSVYRPSSTPTSISTAPVAFQGTTHAAPNSNLAMPTSIEASDPGRRTNVLVQYPRVVSSEGDARSQVYDDMQPYSVSFVGKNQVGQVGHAYERISRISGLQWINEQLSKARVPVDYLYLMDINGQDWFRGENGMLKAHAVQAPVWDRWIKALGDKEKLEEGGLDLDDAPRARATADLLNEWRFDGVLQDSDLENARQGRIGTNNLLFNVGIRGPSMVRNGTSRGVQLGYEDHEFDGEVRVRDTLFVCLHLTTDSYTKTDPSTGEPTTIIDATTGKPKTEVLGTFEYRLWSSRRLWRAGALHPNVLAGLTKQRLANEKDNPDFEKMGSIIGAWRVGSVMDSKAALAEARNGDPHTRSIQLFVSIDGRWIGLVELRDRFGTGNDTSKMLLGLDWAWRFDLQNLSEFLNTCMDTWDERLDLMMIRPDPFKSIGYAEERKSAWMNKGRRKKSNATDVDAWKPLLVSGYAVLKELGELGEFGESLERSSEYNKLDSTYASVLKILPGIKEAQLRYFEKRKAVKSSREKIDASIKKIERGRQKNLVDKANEDAMRVIFRDLRCDDESILVDFDARGEILTTLMKTVEELFLQIYSLSTSLRVDIPGTSLKPRFDAIEKTVNWGLTNTNLRISTALNKGNSELDDVGRLRNNDQKRRMEKNKTVADKKKNFLAERFQLVAKKNLIEQNQKELMKALAELALSTDGKIYAQKITALEEYLKGTLAESVFDDADYALKVEEYIIATKKFKLDDDLSPLEDPKIPVAESVQKRPPPATVAAPPRTVPKPPASVGAPAKPPARSFMSSAASTLGAVLGIGANEDEDMPPPPPSASVDDRAPCALIDATSMSTETSGILDEGVEGRSSRLRAKRTGAEVSGGDNGSRPAQNPRARHT